MGRHLAEGIYGFDDLEVGDWFATATRRVDAEAIDRFAELSGDFFELHMDRAAAERRGFADRVAHGLLVLAMVDGLKNQAEARFRAIASLGWDWSFDGPVLVDDVIRATLTLVDKRLTSKGDRGLARLRFEVRNQTDEIVQSGTNLLIMER